MEGLCFTYRQIPQEFSVWRPELVRQLTTADRDLVEDLPDEAGFLYESYGHPVALLEEGLAFGVIRGVQSLWRIGVRHKIAIHFAEKLEMDEIGSNGREVYLQACPDG